MKTAPLPDPWVTPLLSIAETGEALGKSRATAYAMVKADELRTITVSGCRKVRTVDLYDFLGLPLPPRSA